ncbi:hemerythrin domain-containing protein [Glycomyces buryatensis]|uniref:Hemerythrin domain-containing protein n=1 Tax=Glycomyces buryatensis TaxID=2570927 RepID=A0A4S8QEG8_9ACTN|nr:hemerythrin domain-containing protein [Glycomyces buryatensis]THV42798.1 hemerythrin domain-containing protein [Glycomyces buryatensis]
MFDAEDNTDLVDVILKDHRVIEAVFRELERHKGQADGRKELADHIIAVLVRHAVVEEQYMYPIARERLDDGDEVADHAIQAHGEAEAVMKRLEGLGPDSPEFEELLAELIEDIRHHVSEEESDLLPRLRRSLTQGELDNLGAKVLIAKEHAPTRPHPHAPHKPPANMIVDPGLGLIDRIRDSFAHRHV